MVSTVNTNRRAMPRPLGVEKFEGSPGQMGRKRQQGFVSIRFAFLTTSEPERIALAVSHE
jgi:hypothetical protein